GAQLFIQITGNDNQTIINNYYSSERSRAAQDGVRRFLGPEMPATGHFDHELLYLQQVRDAVPSRAGDRGIIEKFSPKPTKLIFMTEDAKRTVLERPFPFKHLFYCKRPIQHRWG